METNVVSLELLTCKLGIATAGEAVIASDMLLLGERSKDESNVVSIAEVAGVFGERIMEEVGDLMIDDCLIGENAELLEPIRDNGLGLLDDGGEDFAGREGGRVSARILTPLLLSSDDFPLVSTRSTFSSRLSLGRALERKGVVNFWDVPIPRSDDLSR